MLIACNMKCSISQWGHSLRICCHLRGKKVINPRHACAAKVNVGVMCVCVCLSVKSHLTSGASFCPENAVTHSVGNEGQKFVGFSLKSLCCRDPASPKMTTICTGSHFSWGKHQALSTCKARMCIMVFTTWCTGAATSSCELIQRSQFFSWVLIDHASKQGLSTMWWCCTDKTKSAQTLPTYVPSKTINKA